MGQPVKRMKVIEFNGLPGSGKSTISSELIYCLAKRGDNVCDFSEYFSKNKHKRKIIFRAIFHTNLWCIRFLFYYFAFTIKQGIKLSNRIKMIFSTFKQLIFFNYCYRQQAYDFIVIDQGIIQNLISIAYDNLIIDITAVEKIYKDVVKHFPDYYIVNTHAYTETVVQRLVGRKHGTSRLDSLQGTTLYKLIDTQTINFNMLRKYNHYLQSIDIDTQKDVSANATKILEFCDNSHRRAND